MEQAKTTSKIPNSSKTILIACGGTGGHLFPGVSVANQLKKQGHTAILLLSKKAIDAKAAAKYAEFDSLTLPVMAKPRTLSLAMLVFLWELLISIIKGVKIIKNNAVLSPDKKTKNNVSTLNPNKKLEIMSIQLGV